VRIIAGIHRGRALAPVGTGDAAGHLRPTSDRVRESIFNLLINGGYDNPVADARVLDLFAGTGALGLEALSRGAAEVTFVDQGAAANAILRKNIDILRAAAQTRILRQDATQMLRNPAEPYSLIFLDPPYGKAMGGAALTSSAKGGWLAPDAIVVWEENLASPLPPGFTPLDQRKYGDTIVTLLRAPA
jgi:16S rRNA (guanine966-N2)-methyltransferase